MSWLPSLGFISVFQFLSGNTLIVPILHSGDQMPDNKCSGGVIRFVIKVCSLSPCSDFNSALWFYQSWYTSFKKKRKRGLWSGSRAAAGVAPGSAVVEGALGGQGAVGQSTHTLLFSGQSKQMKQSVGWLDL